MKVTIGRVIHVHTRSQGDVAGVVTRVHPGEVVDLTLDVPMGFSPDELPQGSNATRFRQITPAHISGVLVAPGPAPSQWSWPARAAKQTREAAE